MTTDTASCLGAEKKERDIKTSNGHRKHVTRPTHRGTRLELKRTARRRRYSGKPNSAQSGEISASLRCVPP